ncbi:MAG: rhodanese-like domain-containing protein [Chthoniobacter sp.]|nr:rhodanese-like domain-containing protein [Chthoniobacter sp.]
MKVFPFIVAAIALVVGPLQAENPVPARAPIPANVVKNVSPDDAEKLLKDNPKIVVLDVRTAEEFSDGHIAGAKNLDFLSADFAAKVATLDPGKTYLIHCAAGGRSTKALALMEGRNFTAIYHLNEGFKAWVKGGKPVEK